MNILFRFALYGTNLISLCGHLLWLGMDAGLYPLEQAILATERCLIIWGKQARLAWLTLRAAFASWGDGGKYSFTIAALGRRERAQVRFLGYSPKGPAARPSVPAIEPQALARN